MGEYRIQVRIGDNESIEKAQKTILDYANGLSEKLDTFARMVAELGWRIASVQFNLASSLYDGIDDTDVTIEKLEDGNGWRLVAYGRAVLFLEFGAGAAKGYGHPRAGEFGYGPGTYNPSSSNWNNPKGWMFKDEEGWKHTYGNPPAQAMFNADKKMVEQIMEIARKVFK